MVLALPLVTAAPLFQSAVPLLKKKKLTPCISLTQRAVHLIDIYTNLVCNSQKEHCYYNTKLSRMMFK